jgi:hypothetical protein
LGNIKIKSKLKGLFLNINFFKGWGCIWVVLRYPVLLIYLFILGLVGLLRVGGFPMEALPPLAFGAPHVYSLGMVLWAHA